MESDHVHDEDTPRIAVTISDVCCGWPLSEYLAGGPSPLRLSQGEAITYVFRSSTGSPLYIGSSMSGGRICEHARQTWVKDAVQVDVDIWCCIAVARRQEAEQIHRDEPAFNREHNFGNPESAQPRRRVGAVAVPGCALCQMHAPRRRGR